MDKILTLVRGIPGSGKTTFANSMAGSYPVYSADNFFETEAGYKFDASSPHGGKPTKYFYSCRYGDNHGCNCKISFGG